MKNKSQNKGATLIMYPVLSHVQLFVTLWTVVRQAPLSMGLLRQEYGVGCRFLLQGIFQTQPSNPIFLCLAHCRQILYLLSHRGSPIFTIDSKL